MACSLALARIGIVMTQIQLSAATGIPQAMISAIEIDRFNLGVERAKLLARAPCTSSVSSSGSAR